MSNERIDLTQFEGIAKGEWVYEEGEDGEIVDWNIFDYETYPSKLRKAKDVDGDHPIKFLDGSKHELPLKDIDLFINKYMDMKPLDREKMQQVAIMSKEKFDTILSFFKPKHGKPEKSIYE